jgi:hypothetical protein
MSITTIIMNMKSEYFIPSFIGLLLMLTLAISCNNGPVIPSSLNLSITIQGADVDNPNGDGSGKISCLATAKDASRYEYRFDGGDIQESVDGIIEHTFFGLGTNSYVVTVIAYSEDDESIVTSETIDVFRSDSGRVLIFSEEFDVDGPVNRANWTAETHPPNNGCWWNGESQHYTDRIDNAYVSDGTLKIVAKREQYTFEGSTKNYTSARLISKFSFTYGRIDVRARLPIGEGTWPAIWTLGSNINTVGWPACGEIDIMEHWGHNATHVESAIHTVDCSGGCPNVRIGSKTLLDFNTDFHIYSVDWSPETIDFYVDDEYLYSYNPAVKTSTNWPFTADQFMILNVAMGGSWFNIDPSFNQSIMEVDFVRVFQ